MAVHLEVNRGFKALFFLLYGAHLTLSWAISMLLAHRLGNPLALTGLTMAIVLAPMAIYTLKFLDYLNYCQFDIHFPFGRDVQQFGDVLSCAVD